MDDLQKAAWHRDASRAVHDAVPELLEALIWISNNGDHRSKKRALSALKSATIQPSEGGE